MKKAYFVEIKPTTEQAIKINKTIGVCRYVYNFYISKNKEIYEQEKRFMSGYESMETRKMIAAAKEEEEQKKKGLWSRLFGK